MDESETALLLRLKSLFLLASEKLVFSKNDIADAAGKTQIAQAWGEHKQQQKAPPQARRDEGTKGKGRQTILTKNPRPRAWGFEM
ncbi:hypothetical protein, partial [Salinicola sp. DM10]|uniref:hypothetical protein n=1 Tax=Salinicola sp. DM10 TaxID=2815721 RepID=UPI001E4B2222